MTKLVIRVSRAVVLGLAWAGGWVIVSVLTAPLLVGDLEPEHIGGPLYAGITCGALFAELAGIASGRRRLDELSARFAAKWGAASGVVVGVLPFVIGDNGRYQAGWSLLIVTLTVIVAGIAAGRGRSGAFVPAATVTAAASGLIAGGLPWFLTTENSLQRLLPVALMAGLSALAGVSALASRPVARWLHNQHSAGLGQGYDG